MASWFTIYCTRSVSQTTAEDLSAAVNSVDFYTIAEGFGIEDETAVERAVSHLRVERLAADPDVPFVVRYRPSDFRPLLVHVWTHCERVRRELLEAEGRYLAGRSEPAVDQIRAALSAVVEIVAIELGLESLQDMGLVIAGQIAEYFAEAGAGPIRDTADEWWAVRRGVPTLLVGGA